MRVSRWGNSLAVRLPRGLVAALRLKEGDKVSLRPATDGILDVIPDRRREEVLARIKAMQKPLPENYTFDRDEIYDRLGPDSPGREPYES